MDSYVWWFVVGFGLMIAELLTGTFYLLLIGIAFGAAGAADRVERQGESGAHGGDADVKS